MMKLLPLILLCIGCSSALDANQLRNSLQEVDAFNGDIWAVLVAGSNTYDNYRHQADVCHAYQLLKQHGVPAEHIITMMYDDIANNTKNPTRGVIINHPGGDNVYVDVVKDYIGKEVTPHNFLKVLEGDAELAGKGKKVLRSTSKDHVFVYFADHGAPGLIAFPDAELLATDLQKTLTKLSKENKFRKMLVYIEACESGSMFDGHLTADLKILGLTAANPNEPSYACYWDDERETFLGDLFSVEWMQDSESHTDLDSETVQQQFARVMRMTHNSSHVMEYGDVSIGRIPVGQFQGERASQKQKSRPPVTDAVPSHDVPLIVAQRRAAKAQDEHEKQIRTAAYEGVKAGRDYLTHSVRLLAKRMTQHFPELGQQDILTTTTQLTRHECYEELYRAFDADCFDLSSHPFALRFLYVFVNVCQKLKPVSSHVNLLSDFLSEECKKHVKEHPFKSIA